MMRVIIADDHRLICTAIEKMIDSFGEFVVTHKVHSGKELLVLLEKLNYAPELILLDINMPIMDGYAAIEVLQKDYPSIKVLTLSMDYDEESYMRMIRLGAHGFMAKTADEEELHLAMKAVMDRGCYYSQDMADSLFKAARNSKNKAADHVEFTEREIELLGHVCTEMTYAEIADQMCLSPKTVDGYRNALFQKLNAKSRVGLVIYAIKHGYYQID